MRILNSQVNKPEDKIVSALNRAGKRLSEIHPNNWLAGDSDPDVNTGSDGDFYLNNVSSDYFHKVGNSWELKGNLQGNPGKDGLDGADGDVGLSAYEVWIKNGNKGTVNDFLINLIGQRGPKGERGPRGPKGEKGEKGEDGKDGREIELRKSDKAIQWRYTNETKWKDLIALSQLKGPAGQTFIGGGGGGGTGNGIIQSLVAGSNVTIDSTDPANPIISASGGGGGIELGETSTTAYRGDRGKTAYDHSQLVTGNPHAVTKSDVGLGNADNTSDLSKPISTATQEALDLKATDADLDTHTGRTDNPHAVTKAQVGLANADNTSDANKPVSTATQSALDLKANDSAVVHDTGDETIAGVKTFSSDPLIPDEAYDATAWNGVLEPPTKNAVRDKFESLSSGGQSPFDAIVAPSGGDYTTLGAAITAASSGWTIYVKAGTYSESAISTALTNLHIIGEIRENTTLDFVANTATFSGNGVKIENIGTTFTTGGISFTGSRALISDFKIATTGLPATGLGALNFGSQYGEMHHCYFSTTSVASRTTPFVRFSNDYQIIDSNIFLISTQSTGTGALNLVNGIIFSNNYIESLSNTSAGMGLFVQGQGSQIIGNRLTGFGTTAYTIRLSTTECTVANNFFTTAGGGLRCIWDSSSAGPNRIIGNNIGPGGNNCYGIYMAASNSIIANNNIDCSGYSSSTGIYIDSAMDNTVVTGNRFALCTTGITVNNSACDNTVIVGNYMSGATTTVTDNGLNTIIKDNQGVPITLEKSFVRMTNTSGATINAGNIVVMKSVAAGTEVTTTTTAGDNKVFGMAVASIANNASGYIQVLGKTTLMTVNGTTDIAIGDYISCYTSAGIGQKAVAGHMAIAIALEAYTADDSSGVIDALLITPRFM